MAKKTFLVTLSLVVEASNERPETGPSELQQLIRRLQDAATAVLNHPDSPLGVQSTMDVELNPSHLNCGQCAECGSWVTDEERPDREKALRKGARVDGRLLCREHLPPGRFWWAF